jgi:hypothetical protein
MGRRAFTAEEKIEAKKRIAITKKAWRENNKERFDKYMNEYYLQNKKVIDERRIINRKLRKNRLLETVV